MEPAYNKTTIFDLPTDITAHIFSYISPVEAINNVPLVCRHFNELMSDRIPWPVVLIPARPPVKLTYHGGLKKLFELSHFDVDVFSLPKADYMDKPDEVLEGFLDLEWKRLTKVNLPLGPEISDLVTTAPNLKELMLETHKELEPWMWEEIGQLGSHKSLKKLVIVAKEFHWPLWLDYNEIMGPFLSKLERFSLCTPKVVLVDPILPDDRSSFVINIGKAPNLKEVQVLTEMCYAIVHNEPELREVSEINYPKLEKLSLRGPGRFASVFLFDPSFLAPFSNLTELRLDGRSSLGFQNSRSHFSPSTAAVLQQLRKLEIQINHLSNFNMAAIARLVNLRWLYLDLGRHHCLTRDEPRALQGLKSLKTLVNLEGLELRGLKGGRLKDTCGGTFFKNWSCNLKWLSFRGKQEQAHRSGAFIAIMEKFPNLERLCFKLGEEPEGKCNFFPNSESGLVYLTSFR